MGITITSPADGPEADRCSYCGRVFDKTNEDDEAIQTLDARGEVTLCRPCYDKAGNSVR